MGRYGQAITLLTAEDSGKWRQFERALGLRFPRQSWTGTHADTASTHHAAAAPRPAPRVATPSMPRVSTPTNARTSRRPARGRRTWYASSRRRESAA
jgi:hypothetical protein